MPSITPFLWFDGRAHEAAAFYTSIFRDSHIESSSHGSVTFVLREQRLIAFDGGPAFAFTPAVSLFVECRTQDELDELWERLSEGGQIQRCGWLTDRFGVSWQIVPAVLGAMLGDEDDIRCENVMQAMLAMTKLDIAALTRAFNG